MNCLKRLLGGVGLLAGLCWAVQAAEPAPAGIWQVSLADGPDKNSAMLTVEAGDFRVRFAQRPAWTLYDLDYQSRKILQPSGGTGAVVQWERDDPYVSAADFGDWPAFQKYLRLAAAKPGSAAEKLHRLLPPGTLDAAEPGPELLAALNAALENRELFAAAFLDELPESKSSHVRLYAQREWQALKTAGEAKAVAAHNRRLLDWFWAGRLRPVQETIGTVHGGEAVTGLCLEVDGQEVPIMSGGRLVCAVGTRWQGRRIVFRKQSLLGPFDHEASFDFSAAGPKLTIRHRFTANPEMARGHFAGYRYTFMFMMPEAMDRWLVVAADGRAEEQILPPEAKAGQLINRPFKALVCYAPAWQTGIAYVYPQAYAGSNHLDVRPGKDRKFRASLFADHYEAGQTVEYQLQVEPFAARAKQWPAIGTTLVGQ